MSSSREASIAPSPSTEPAEWALRESEERLRFTLEAGQLGFWQHDLRTDALACSDRCKAHFGRTPLEPLSHDEALAAVHPEDRERARETIGRAVRAGEGYDLEYRVVWPGGTVRWLMVRGRASYDVQGRPVGTVGVPLDVTGRKEAEARQAEQAERLRLLSESAEHLQTTADPETMVRDPFDRVRRYLRLDLYHNYMLNGGSGKLELISSFGLPHPLEIPECPAWTDMRWRVAGGGMSVWRVPSWLPSPDAASARTLSAREPLDLITTS